MLELVLQSFVGVVAVVCLLVLFVFTLSKFFSSSKPPGPNPFLVDGVKPTRPLVTDKSARDKVLKRGFQAKLVPEQLDAIVIGSGIGGLTAAAILSKVGKKVLVLEQHDQAGGCCHTFTEKGFEFDVGIHYIGEMRSKTITKLLIDQLTAGQLQWCDLPDDFDVIALGEPGKQQFHHFTTGGPAAYKKTLLKKFPKEEQAIDKYLAQIREVRRNMMGMMMVKALPKWIVRVLITTGLINVITGYFKYARKTLKQVLDELTDDNDLKAVLSYSWGDYGVPPSKSSFALHASLINHYLYGASYPRGGSSEIAFSIIPVIESAGGCVLVRAPVSEILTNSDGKVAGVRVNRSSGSVDIMAPIVISDAGVVNTFTKLLPHEVAKRSSIPSLIGRKVDLGIGCMQLFVGLSGTAEELNIKPHNLWYYISNDIDGLMEEYVAKPVEDACEADLPMLFISFPSAKDPTSNERYPGKTTCTVVTVAKWEWFQQWQNERVMKRGDDYNAIKMAFGRRMWEQVLTVYPQLADKVEYLDVGTPVTSNYYLSTLRGEIYGLDHNVRRFGNPETMMHLRAETDIPGLYLTGQDILSCGFTGAMFGGLLCGSAILQRNLYKDLIDLRGRVGKAK